MQYVPYSERIPDSQYKNTLKEILEKGELTRSQQEVDAITLIAPPPMRFRLSNGFPLITERSLDRSDGKIATWQAAIGELFAFINGARTIETLKEFKCFWWKLWATPEKCLKRGLDPGDLGPGSYGAAFHDFPMPNGETFNQFASVLTEIQHGVHLRTHFISPWIPYYIPRTGNTPQQVVVAPCHGWIHIRIINGKLTLHMFQRSADMILGVPSNAAQYAALTLALGHLTGYPAYEYIHSFSDAHIYANHRDAAEEMIRREPRRLPTVTLAGEERDLFSYRHSDFILSDYHPHPKIELGGVAV